MHALQRLVDRTHSPAGGRWRLVGTDLLVISLLLVAGELRHDVNPVTEPLAVVETAVPFLFGWFVVATLVGAYSDRALGNRVWSVRLAVGGWFGAVAIGAILRGSPYFAGGIPWTFLAVMAAFGTVTLAVARTAFVTFLAD
ncbi:DUF3054 domain-containing protein [Haloarchaeobius sp. HRN-SO-5]|uniref:DUF3054 domain-containing protein n=1 Tax=Haloarchaeobius sp. HRN-SO-5 TaxID=3446118 RepID=UPI003EBAB4CA